LKPLQIILRGSTNYYKILYPNKSVNTRQAKFLMKETSTNTLPRQNRITVLDSFRAIAAMSVLFYHFDNRHFEYGYYGVQLFFIISGFVIFKTIEAVKSSKEFIVKRFFKLFPTYWVCMSLTFLVILLSPAFTDLQVSIRDYLSNLTMIATRFGANYIDNAYWSLEPELAFYVFICVIYAFNKIQYIQIIGIAWLCLILVNYAAGIETYFPAIRLFNIRHGQLFFSGILFYKMYKDGPDKFSILGICCCYIISLLVYIKADAHRASGPVVIAAITIIYSLFFLFLFNRLGFLSNKVLVFLGGISYPLYLLHQSLGLILIKRMQVSLHMNYVTAFFIMMSVVLTLAYLVNKYVEKFSLKMSRKIISNLRLKETA
jgi:peptidoglycan/LPS O-acetylase OafA/YrhL